ncbi:MAG: peptidylprolyl isomerase [Candidatus Aureabacteria bacterium]|nr:peptidylprolyl isomerase [Candidatus Auribacterota bacterium]
MRKQKIAYFIMGAALGCLLLSLVPGFSENESASSKRRFTIDGVVAVVNNDVITQTDLIRSLFPLIKQLKSEYSGPELNTKIEEIKKEILEQLIENKLILQTAVEMQGKELQVPEKEILQHIERIIAKFPSREVFEDALEKENLSFEDFKKDCTDQLLVKHLVSKEVSSKVYVSNSDIEQYYHSHEEEFKVPAMITFSQIWIKKEADEKNTGAKKALIESIAEEIKNGKDFKALAIEHSEDPHAKDGGLWNDVKKGQFMPEIDQVLWTLKPGEVSTIIETSSSFHILKVESIQKADVVPIKEVWDTISNKLYIQQADRIRKEWIDRLRQKAFIQVNEDF